MNAASGRCLDAKAAATANGTVVQQYACNGSTAQQWSCTATSDGYVRINNRNNTAQVADVADVSTADNAPVHLGAYGGGANQQWLPVDEGGGASAATATSTSTRAWPPSGPSGHRTTPMCA